MWLVATTPDGTENALIIAQCSHGQKCPRLIDKNCPLPIITIQPALKDPHLLPLQIQTLMQP